MCRVNERELHVCGNALPMSTLSSRQYRQIWLRVLVYVVTQDWSHVQVPLLLFVSIPQHKKTPCNPMLGEKKVCVCVTNVHSSPLVFFCSWYWQNVLCDARLIYFHCLWFWFVWNMVHFSLLWPQLTSLPESARSLSRTRTCLDRVVSGHQVELSVFFNIPQFHPGSCTEDVTNWYVVCRPSGIYFTEFPVQVLLLQHFTALSMLLHWRWH